MASGKKKTVKAAGAKASARKAPAKKRAATRKPDKRQAGDAAANAVDEQLARYRSMRDFHITAEPSGSIRDAKKTANPSQLPFCIQKHAASHLHYDSGWAGMVC